MSKKYWWSGLFLLVVFLIAGLWLNEPAKVKAEPKTGVMVGDKFPAFTVTNSAGELVSISPGSSPVVINFWATWCPPCRAELPELADFARSHEGTVAFYGIDLQESPQTVEPFLEELQVVLPVVYDRDGKAARTFAVRFIPTTIVANAQGIILFRKSGPVTAEELNSVLNQ